MSHPDIKDSDISILLFANKMDLPDALTPNECMEQLELEKIRHRDWHISACNAFTGYGVNEGIDWLSRSIAEASIEDRFSLLVFEIVIRIVF